jgi:hypothetical protein
MSPPDYEKSFADILEEQERVEADQGVTTLSLKSFLKTAGTTPLFAVLLFNAWEISANEDAKQSL